MIRTKGTRSQQRQWTSDLAHNVYKGKCTYKVPKIPQGLRMARSAAFCNLLSQSSDLCSHNTLHSLSEGVHCAYYVQLTTFKCWNIFVLSFASKELLCECSRHSKQLSVTMPWGVQKFETCFWFKHGNKSVEHCEHSGWRPKWYSKENIDKRCNIMQEQQNTTSEITGQFRRSVWKTPVNCKGGYKHVADLCKFSALVAHPCAEAAGILGQWSFTLLTCLIRPLVFFISLWEWIFSYNFIISACSWSLWTITDWSTCSPQMLVTAVLMALEKKLDLLNKHGRGTTLQGKTTNNNDFCIHCITGSVQELTDVPL